MGVLLNVRRGEKPIIPPQRAVHGIVFVLGLRISRCLPGVTVRLNGTRSLRMRVLLVVRKPELTPCGSTMITAVKTRKGSDAITSDQWHVVHARFLGADGRCRFGRSVTSEHVDRGACVKAARALLARIRAEAGEVPPDQRDEVFVRRPGFKSLKTVNHRVKRSAPGGRRE